MSRVCLRQHEAAFIARRSRREINNMQRRGDRLKAKGLTDEEVVAAGALPSTWTAGRRTVAAAALRRCVANDPIALVVLEALCGGRLVAPRPRDPTAIPPDTIEVIHRL